MIFFYLNSQQQESTDLKLEKIADKIYCISGAGGNIAVLESRDQFLLVDAGYSKTANQVIKKLAELSSANITHLISTHYHGDHTSGNAILGKGAKIFSHKNCRNSLIKNLKKDKTPESIGAPTATFDNKMVIDLDNGRQMVTLLHFGPAHTSGDTVVVFEFAKVLHTGDLFFNGIAPYIDVQNGSNTENWIRTIEVLANIYPDYTVIPGHGPVTDMKTYLKFRDYLKFLRTEVQKAKQSGKTKKEAMESIDLSAYKDIAEKGDFLTKKNNIAWIYEELSRATTSDKED
jgi:glyoxylase-like metal-dependent hydrolase (beta-lactamase superfamily II)